MLDRDLLSELQLTLIEPPDGGDTWPSLIWTRDEVLDALNAAIRALARDTHVDVSRAEIFVPAGTTSVALPADWLASAALVWRSVSAPYSTQVLADGAVSYWPLDDPPGSPTVRDLAGGRPGTVVPGSTFLTLGVPGLRGTAAQFGGADAGIRIGDSPSPYPTFTLEAWVYQQQNPNPDFIAGMVFSRSTPNEYLQGTLILSTIFGSWLTPPYFFESITITNTDDPGGQWTQFTGIAVPEIVPGQWTHLVGTYDGTTLTVYRNAAVVLTATFPQVPDVPPRPQVSWIGQTEGLPTEVKQTGFYGRLQNVAWYPQALSAAQVATHYALAFSAPLLSTRTPLGSADAFEGDLAVPGWETIPGLPLAYADLDADTLTLRLVPTPATDGTLELLYIRVPPEVTALTPPGDPLPLIDEFTSGIKYATLAWLLRKVGRLLDPERAEYCEQRYKLTEVAATILLDGWS